MKKTIRKIMLASILVVASGIAMAQLNFTTRTIHVSCPTGSDATITVDVTSGNKGNIIVQWENTLTNESDLVVVKGAPAVVKFPNDGQKQLPISAGEYVITVVDASDVKNIDSKTSTINIKQPGSVDFVVYNPDEGLANGKIRVKVINPDDFYTYQFSIDNITTFQTDPTFKNLAAQSYVITVKVTSGNTSCLKSYSVDLKP